VIKMHMPRIVARIALGATFAGGVMVAAASGFAAPAMALSTCQLCVLGAQGGTQGAPSAVYSSALGIGYPGAHSFGQVAAAPVDGAAPINQIVGTVGAPLVNVNVPCPAPWNQGGVAGADYNACNAAPVAQGLGAGPQADMPSHGFSQVAAAPVRVGAPVSQLVGTVGAPLVNVNIPCPAPWLQGGLLGSRYNACNAAPVSQG
jgi:hypothetical protein